MRVPIAARLVVLALGASTVPVVSMWLLAAHGQGQVLGETRSELEELGRQNLVQVARDVHRLCSVANGLLQPTLDRGLDAARGMIARAGGLSLDGSRRTWHTVDQETGAPTQVSLPGLSIGRTPVLENRSPQVPSLVVDEVKATTGLYCSIFQKMNEQGDMLRIVSSVIAEDGSRGTGLFLPAVLPDGATNPVVATVRQGQTHRGMTRVAGKMYLAAYAPLAATSGETVGMIAVAVDTEVLDQIQRTLRETRVARSGGVTAIGMHGKQRGVAVVGGRGEHEGAELWDARDEAGRPYLREQLARAGQRSAGEVFLDRWTVKGSSGAEPHVKMAALVTFEPWDWLIRAETSESDFLVPEAHVEESIRTLLAQLAAGGLLLLLVAAAGASVFALRLTRPLSTLSAEARRVGEGDLREVAVRPLAPGERDETRLLAHAFQRMAAAVASLVGNVQRSGIQVTTAATEIAASARQLDGAVASQAAATQEVTASAREIAGTADALGQVASSVASVASQTARHAEEGRLGLAEMEGAMRRLSAATASVSGRLGAISERASSIGVLMATVTRVADQTNLLSLNAAIEAEKAGEGGRGFAVLAREIRRLADQTSSATLDIERAVRDLHAAVSSGVMEMDRFVEEVRRATAEVQRTSADLAGIVEAVAALDPRFAEVQAATAVQRDEAAQIGRAMSSLAATAGATRDSLSAFQDATTRLSGAVASLRDGIATFRVAPGGGAG